MEISRIYMEMAMAEAALAFRDGTYPIGAVIVGPDGTVLSRGRNRVYPLNDPTAHAEMDAIRQAGPLLRDPLYKHRCTIYTTVEPCLMCTGALIFADIDRVVWATNDDWGGAVRAMVSGSFMPQKFARFEVAAAPFPDLDQQMREIHLAFDRQRGLNGLHWEGRGPRRVPK